VVCWRGRRSTWIVEARREWSAGFVVCGFPGVLCDGAGDAEVLEVEAGFAAAGAVGFAGEDAAGAGGAVGVLVGGIGVDSG